MGALILVESWILALTTSTAAAQGLSAPPTWVRPMGVHACPSHPGVQATWLISEATAGQVQPSVLMRVGLGPFIDMDNRRQDDEDRERRRQEKLRQEAQREEELREHYRTYGYTYPPFIYADPRLGPYSRDPQTGYYNYGTRYYYSPDTGQYYDVYK